MAKLIDLIVSGKSSFANDISAKNIYADNFIRNGSSNNYVLLGGGGHKALSDFSMSHSHPYLSYSSVYPTNTINLNDYFSTSTMYRVYYDYSGSSKIQNGPYESDAGAVINFPTYSGTQVYFNYYNNDVKVRTHYNGHITNWATFITSENIGSQSVNYSASAGNADTLDSFHSNRFTFVYNSANYNDKSSLTVNQMAADGNSNSHVGMIYAGTDNPVSSSGNWVHVWSQTWARGTISSWCSQIALGVQQGTGMWYRTTSGALAGRAWNRVLDSANYTSYVNNYYWANVKISTSSNSATYPTFGSLAVINDSCDNSNNSLAYFQHRSNNDWTVKIDSGSYDYGLQINGSQTGTNALSVTGASRFTNTIRIGNGSTALDGNYCEGIRIRAADNTWATIILGATADTGTNTYAWSIHRTSGNNFSISRNSADGANGLLIDTSGRVGIGTTSPSERLSVNGWVGTIGNTGWYSITYAGGIYMTDSTWVRVYNNKKFYVSNSSSDAIHSAGGVYVAGMIHSYGNYLKSSCNGAYVQIGPQNSSHAHYVTDAGVSHWFNKTVQVDGNIEPYGNNEHSAGSTSYRFSNVYSYSGNFAGTITSSSYHQIYNSGSYTKPSSNVTGAIVIQLPITSSQYDMINVEIAVYEYNSQAASKIIVGGHPWQGKWYNYSCSVIGGYSREIRLGIYGGKWSIILGTSSTVWSYPGVFVTHIGTVYDAYSSAYASQCTLSLVTSESGFSALFTPTNVLKATHSAYASSAGNADTVDGQHFNWNNNKNDHTYLWAASSNGQAYLVHRASMSVNYANTASGLDLNRTSIKTGAAGWYKLAYYASTDPRGSVRIGLVTTGGSFVPFYAELYVENGWGIINMVLYGRFDYISKFRFTSDSTNCYIEGYFPNANTEITLQKIKGVSYVSDYTSGWNLYTTATSGSGTVQDSENARSSLSSGLYTNRSIEGNGFVKSGSSDSYILLGGGGHKLLSDFSMAHSHPYLPTAGGTMTGAINLSNTNAKLAFGSLATSPITGYKAPYLQSNGVGIYSRYGGSSDEGAIIITEDTCVIYNSSDTGWNFQVMDKDIGTDMTNDATRSFGVNSEHQAWSLSGFVKSGSSDSYVLLGGGGHKALSDFSMSHSYPYLPLSGGTCTGNIYAPAFYESSDERLKDFYNSVDVDLDKLSSLPKKFFKWKFNHNGEFEIGTSAQELQKIYPQLVNTDDKGYLTVAYDKLSIIALRAIDKLYEMNKNLERRIQILESKH